MCTASNYPVSLLHVFMATNLTEGNVFKRLIAFSIPYLIACFLQTFYGIADLFIAGRYNGSSTITAISIGSQIMHMMTLLLAGIAMGTTVLVGRAFGAKDETQASFAVGNSISLFAMVSVALMVFCLLFTESMATILQTPPEAFEETVTYTEICFAGLPLIAAYNVIASTCRGVGDSRHPMLFVAFGGIFNIILDYILIGPFGMGASGAALATVIAQFAVVLLALITLPRLRLGVHVSLRHLKFELSTLKNLLNVGIPTACQDGFIQIAFLFITAIANARGLAVATSVGIVEKMICFFFLVPSAMLAGVSAMASQNRGAGSHDRGRKALHYGMMTCAIYGLSIGILCQFISPWLMSFFTKDPQVIVYGTQYLRTYAFDVLFAGIHFCFSGYFCAYDKAGWAFFHNVVSSVTTRVPGTWITTVLFPLTLAPMGAVAPIGSVLSVLICVLVYRHYRQTDF